MSQDSFLPHTFPIHNSHDLALHIQATVLHPVSISIQDILNDSLLDPKTVLLSEATLAAIGTHQAFCIEIQSGKDHLRHGYMLKVDGTKGYVILDSVQPLIRNQEKTPKETLISVNVSDTVALWKLDNPPRGSTGRKFSMKPPSSVSLKAKSHYTLSPQSGKNPLEFLTSRYFSTLYSLTTPLSYFPKTAFARFRNMCANDSSIMKQHLLSVFLTTEKLEQRHRSKFGLVKADMENQHSVISETEKENQNLFLAKYFTDMTNEEKIERLVLELKIREAQLQLLILMELLHVSTIDEESFLQKGNAKQAEAMAKMRPSLVRKKKKKADGIIPTLLGVAVHDQTTAGSTSVTDFTLYLSLVTLVDQMGLWDVLLGRVKNEKDESMYGFLAYVLVPYFNKQLPQIVQFVIRTVKDLRPKLKVPKLKSKRQRSLSESVTDLSPQNLDEEYGVEDTTSTADENSEPQKRKSKYAKQLLREDQKPFLRQAATTLDDGQMLQSAFLLKRSKSNLGSKNLKRRQVDMSISRPDQPDVDAVSSLFLFGDARRTKTMSALDLRQVEATPLKKARSVTNTRKAEEDKLPQILATPSTNRTVHLDMEVQETPHVSSGSRRQQQLSVQEKLVQLTKLTDFSQDSEHNNLFLRSNDVAIQSSPVNVIGSSPVKSRPGQQITLLRSPVFNFPSNGSPRALMKRPALSRRPVLTPVKVSDNIESPFQDLAGDMAGTSSSKSEILQPVNVASNNTFEESGEPPKVPTTLFKPPKPRPQTRTVLSVSDSFSHIPFETDTDSDSDYERLLATAARPVVRKYSKRK